MIFCKHRINIIFLIYINCPQNGSFPFIAILMSTLKTACFFYVNKPFFLNG